jgi:hypothetical protein
MLCKGVTISPLPDYSWTGERIKRCWAKTKQMHLFKEVGHIVFEDVGSKLSGCSSASSYAKLLLCLHLQEEHKIDADTNHLGLLNDVMGNMDEDNKEKRELLFTEAFCSMEKKSPVLTYFSMLSPAVEGVGFEKARDKFYMRDADNHQKLLSSYALIYRNNHTGTHCDTIAERKEAAATIGTTYKSGSRRHSDAFGYICRPLKPSPDPILTGKIFITQPPGNFSQVRKKMVEVLQERKDTEVKRQQIATRSVRQKTARPNLRSVTKAGQIPPRTSPLTSPQESVLIALSSDPPQPQPLFKGKFCGPAFTVSELKQMGFKCAHHVKPDSAYLFPRRTWHTVLNTKNICVSHAYDCLFNDFCEEGNEGDEDDEGNVTQS